ncbi:CBASS cGAMP-activated phospholipase [Litchfieldia alkalitelluris]|uniref:CBASS cGAMP-activated phospholipase n=1 Tax=Litchfieldia alkalitelluris TaxID=304268 RepID=UPI0009967B3E|nr:CBASS cGAMP-activated phospholipase [Litchfieldia alkalitelluris]
MKILCIDGGGIRGVFAISILKQIENELGECISNYFDVIAGTSTGSIIAASITMKRKMSDVLQSYEQYGKKIFIPKSKFGLFKSIYSDQYLRKYLKEAFRGISLEDIDKPLLIPAVNASNGKPYVHRSNFGHPESKDLSIELWDAVLSSCSAPIYFPPNNVKNNYLSIDGGLWANNPSLVCITDALHHFNEDLKDIKIFSLGTGIQTIHYSIDQNKYWGLKKWLPFHFPEMKFTPKLIDLALNLSSESVTYHCQQLLGKNYLRINCELGKEIPFDDIDSIFPLIELGKEVFTEKKEEIKNFFLSE